MNIDKNTVAVVTGAASGIGRALAVRLAREGAQLAIADVNAAGLAETAQLAAQHGGKVTTHLVDVSDRERYAQFVDQVIAEHGRAQLIVNNAGVALAGTTEDLAIEDYEWLMGVNFWGVVYGTKFFLPVLRQQPSAHIVNISSVFGIIGPAGQSAYVSSKFAVRGFTEVLRHELQGSSVKISVVHPGGIKTNIARAAKLGRAADPEALKREQQVFERAARTTPEDAAERIVQGVLRDEERILIGKDAWAIDKVQRLMPVRYWRLLGKMIEKMAKQ